MKKLAYTIKTSHQHSMIRLLKSQGHQKSGTDKAEEQKIIEESEIHSSLDHIFFQASIVAQVPEETVT